MSASLATRLQQLKDQSRAGFVPFIMAGDPDMEASADILEALPAHGADIIEIGLPFSDPTADGPTIQAAGARALKNGYRLSVLFTLIETWRKRDAQTPLIAMGYANPIFHYGIEAFMQRAGEAGIDGLIIVDVPAEERAPYREAAKKHGLSVIPLIAPTSLQEARLNRNLDGADAFIYYIAIKGITGTHSADLDSIKQELTQIRAHSNLPIAVGFGIRTRDDVAAMAPVADLIVVGSEIVKAGVQTAGNPAQAVLDKVSELASGIPHK